MDSKFCRISKEAGGILMKLFNAGLSSVITLYTVSKSKRTYDNNNKSDEMTVMDDDFKNKYLPLLDLLFQNKI